MKKVLLALVSASVIVSVACAFTACSSSSSSPDTSGTPEAGSDARKEAGGPLDSGPEDSGQTSEQCIAACEQKFAAGLPLDKKIDDCWAQHCQDPCVNGTGTFDAGTGSADAGDAGDAGGDGGAAACTNQVETGDPACNACTIAFCCGAWDGCFSDQTCSDLNDCRSNCP